LFPRRTPAISRLAIGPAALPGVNQLICDRVGFLPWQKLFLPGQWKKPVKTVAKTSKTRQKLAKSKTP